MDVQAKSKTKLPFDGGMDEEESGCTNPAMREIQMMMESVIITSLALQTTVDVRGKKQLETSPHYPRRI